MQGYTKHIRDDGSEEWIIDNIDEVLLQSTQSSDSTTEYPQISGEQLQTFLINQLRAERNRRIAETDWWASSDLTMTDEQRAYRQALRDITNTYKSLDEVVWPIKPTLT
jgi:hypothetical protein